MRTLEQITEDEKNYNDSIINKYLDNGDIAHAISYALMLTGKIPDSEREQLANKIANSFNDTPSVESIREFVDSATTDLEPPEGNYEDEIDAYYDHGPTGIANPADYINNDDERNATTDWIAGNTGNGNYEDPENYELGWDEKETE
ncbi:MAG: hypothetical protein J6Y02_03835 [Pseudobutyrivibrio sp.]|nr:hypothetical protein [Pseudobutyrivibrio sp.]